MDGILIANLSGQTKAGLTNKANEKKKADTASTNTTEELGFLKCLWLTLLLLACLSHAYICVNASAVRWLGSELRYHQLVCLITCLRHFYHGTFVRINVRKSRKNIISQRAEGLFRSKSYTPR